MRRNPPFNYRRAAEAIIVALAVLVSAIGFALAVSGVL